MVTYWRVRLAYWLTKATDTYSEYVLLTAFPQHHFLREHNSMLCFTYIAVVLRWKLQGAWDTEGKIWIWGLKKEVWVSGLEDDHWLVPVDTEDLFIYQYSRANKINLLYSVYYELTASTCFEHSLLIFRRCCTNNNWYIACVLCRLAATRVGVERQGTQHISAQARWSMLNASSARVKVKLSMSTPQVESREPDDFQSLNKKLVSYLWNTVCK
jgi:hypothetical protein